MAPCSHQKAIDYLKLSRRYSGPTPVKIWKTRSTSDYSNDATLLKNPTQGSDPSSPTLPKIRAEMTPESSLSSSTTELIGISQTEYTKTAEAKRDIEDFWIEKDKERLEVIASKEKTMTEMQRKLDNTVNAFQIASDANHKLQAQIEKRTTYLSQMEEDIDYISHNLNAADMENERLEKDLAHSRRDQKYQFDRAEEALILIMADPSKKSVAKLLEAKTEAESRSISQQRAMESEMDSLKLQLEERCDSVVRLTETLSRVADSDRWKDIKIEMEELKIRANNLPDELQAAWRECEKWKGQYETLWRKQEELLWEQASLEERYRFVKDYDLKAMRELRRDLQNEAATSQRALKGCLKQVFERMVRCSLCLESEGYLPFDRQHRAICDQVLELTNQDYQQALSDYYDEHDIREEFNLKEEDDDYSATVENKSFLFKVAPAADLEEMSKEKTPIFKSFSTSQTAEANTAVSKNPATKKGSEATEAQKETTNSTTLFSTQHPDFNFGGSNSPVSFTGLSSSFPAQVPPPASTGMFSMKKPKSPSVETEESGEKASEKEMPKEKEPKAKVPGDDAFREEKPKVNAPGDDPHGEKKLRETEQKKLPKENSVALNEVPSPSEPNRRQKRAAMKRQQKAAKKAEKEAQNAKAEARRRVQQALMMK